MTDDQQLKALENDWMSAWQRKDKVALESILAPDYCFTLSTDPTRSYTREEWLTQALGGYSCRSFAFDAVSVRILEPYAIVTSRYHQEASVGGVDRSHDFFLVDMWRRTGQNWQVVARHSAWPEPVSHSTQQFGRST